MTGGREDAPGTADWVVIRRAPGLPPGAMPGHLDGRWFDRAQMYPVAPDDPPAAVACVPAGRFEVRDDGAVAEVWEVRQ